ncbi:unnamed protein product [Cyprideis torosa]|uniref:Pantoate--beta-alanine ligase n=1 Tax=Cyprideis torosa TaxID=163714 RepID=A0A7R8WME0_9CRUS|nr:unnamed protein product [Cyprideis torosa]CAG0905230.1 unnamed protein product [Cyprideis torosa]
MGALHEGHFALVEKSLQDCDYTICSIFVNPTQFNNAEDFEKYPQTFEQDIEKLQQLGCDFLYAPTVADIYPNGLETDDIYLNGLDNILEGKYRPGHFQGVVTVVSRLFEHIKPHIAYFGEKDFQQLTIIKYMVNQLNLKVKIVGFPTVREENGLALSSRNMRLSTQEKQDATILYNSLLFAKNNIQTYSLNDLYSHIEKEFSNSSLELEYFLIVNEVDLQEPTTMDGNAKLRALIAAYAGKAANIQEGEKVQIVNVNNGERLETYTIPGNSGEIILNGPAARLVQKGDVVIIIAYAYMTPEEYEGFQPTVIFPNEETNLLQ